MESRGQQHEAHGTEQYQAVQEQSGKSNRGFAAMDRDRQRQIARKGGKAAHAKGVAHEYTADEARDAGRKGGQIIGTNRRHMAEIGRLGGLAKRRNQLAAAPGTTGSESDRGPDMPGTGQRHLGSHGAPLVDEERERLDAQTESAGEAGL